MKSNRLIGFARVLTDFIDTALVMDVIIDSRYRSKGYGSYILDAIANHKKLKCIKNIDLHCKNNLEIFYKNKGFCIISDMIWLRKKK